MTAIADGLPISPDLTFPSDVATETIGLLAARGAGKTNAARVLAEEMYRAHLPFVVVDPVGSWYGLRSSRDGSGPGLSIPIFGGKRGDVPLERSGGTLVADLVAGKRLSCILDLTSFDSEAGKKAFLLDFARRLYQQNEQPLHLFLEEADDYIPQRPMRDEAQLLRAWENIVRRGRSRGLGMTMITQRSASINKSVLTQVQTLIAMRTTGPQDRAAIEEWLKYHDQSREILTSLPSLENGEAWVWSPQFLHTTVKTRFRLSETFDSGATPKVGPKSLPPATLADVDLGEIQEAMAATIERAKADDPRELKRRIVELERQLKAKPTERVIERVEVPVVPQGMVDAVRGNLDTLESEVRAILNTVQCARACLSEGQDLVEGVVNYSATIPNPIPSKRERAQSESRPLTEGISVPQQRVLDAIARLNGAGIAQPTRQTIAAIAGYSWRSGGFANIVSALRTAGLVEYPTPAVVVLTEEGQKAARSVDPIETVAELHEAWLALLPLPAQKLLRVLIDRYPAELTRQQLADLTGYSAGSGGFANLVGKLHTFGAADYPSRGTVRAADLLFPEGL